jgi:hypothetical protein
VAERLAAEVDAVRGYVRAWRGTGAVLAADTQHVAEELRARLADVVHAWPPIAEDPMGERADGRFVKAFPLEFPMGQGDLRQPRLRATPRAVEAVQHLFRYCTGHLLRANRGHRVVWSLFNTALRDLAYERGSLVHKSTDQAVLTKAELRELLDARQDLVSRVAAGGAEVPTTSMHWKREATNLQWLVRQMSWPAPWVEAEPRAATEPRWERALARLGKAKAKARAAAGGAAPEEAVAGGAEAEEGDDGADRDGGEEELAEEAGGAARASSPTTTWRRQRACGARLRGAGRGGARWRRRGGGRGAGGRGGERSLGSAPEELWRRAPPGRPLPDAFGYGRIPPSGSR